MGIKILSAKQQECAMPFCTYIFFLMLHTISSSHNRVCIRLPSTSSSNLECSLTPHMFCLPPPLTLSDSPCGMDSFTDSFIQQIFAQYLLLFRQWGYDNEQDRQGPCSHRVYILGSGDRTPSIMQKQDICRQGSVLIKIIKYNNKKGSGWC